MFLKFPYKHSFVKTCRHQCFKKENSILIHPNIALPIEEAKMMMTGPKGPNALLPDDVICITHHARGYF